MTKNWAINSQKFAHAHAVGVVIHQHVATFFGADIEDVAAAIVALHKWTYQGEYDSSLAKKLEAKLRAVHHNDQIFGSIVVAEDEHHTVPRAWGTWSGSLWDGDCISAWYFCEAEGEETFTYNSIRL